MMRLCAKAMVQKDTRLSGAAHQLLDFYWVMGRVFEISMSYDLKMLVREDEPRRGDLTDIGFCMPYFFL
jgi:hypothetical protein